jgi:hypothetical protein
MAIAGKSDGSHDWEFEIVYVKVTVNQSPITNHSVLVQYRSSPFNPFTTFHLYIYHQYLTGTTVPVHAQIALR